MKSSPAARCISVTKSGVRCSLKCAPWGDGNLCRTHFHRTPLPPPLSNEELTDWIRATTKDDPERLKQVAALLLESCARVASSPHVLGDADVAPVRVCPSDEPVARESPLKRRREEEAARGWARFRQKLQTITSYLDAQTLADAVPRDARERERTLHVRLGRFLQTRVVSDAASSEERAELDVLLLRLSSPIVPVDSHAAAESILQGATACS